MVRQLLFSLALILVVAGCLHAEDEKISVLLLDGQNNHDFTLMTPLMRDFLIYTGRYTVDVTTSPPGDAPQEAWDEWRPNFADYDVIVSNYNGQSWPDPVKASFDEYVRHGGGVLIYHAANNAFPGWTEYDQMIGLGWRGADYGDRVYLDEEGNVVRQPAGEGPGAGHGSQYAWQVRTRDADNPVMRDLPEVWLHATDELYHGQRGPAENMHILATAYSDPAQGGTGQNELMVWWIPYGEGKVLTNLMGHVGYGQYDRPSIRCVGFLTLLDRSCEWLATGEVTSQMPSNFPTADEAVLIANPPTN